MEERREGYPVGDPGQEEECKNCPNRSDSALTNVGYSCIAVKASLIGEISHRPQWVLDKNGGVSCSDLRHPLGERVLATVAAVSQLLTSYGIQLPQ